MKEALKEKMENEIDLREILTYEERFKNKEPEYISFEEIKKRLEIWLKVKSFLDKNVAKELEKLDLTQQRIIANWTDRNLVNSQDPWLSDKLLKGNLEDYWKQRVGNYRVIVKIDDTEIKTLIIGKRQRKDFYKKP